MKAFVKHHERPVASSYRDALEMRRSIEVKREERRKHVLLEKLKKTVDGKEIVLQNRMK